MPLPLEDLFSDIVGKAQRGLNIADSELATRAGVDPARIRAIRVGDSDEKVARLIAPLLGLNAEALVASGKKSWQPCPVEKLAGFADFTTPFEDLLVNAYVAWDPESREAVAFDTGSDCAGMLDLLNTEHLSLKLILLTHTHGDHIYDLDRLKSKTGAPVFVSAREPLDGTQTFEAGKIFQVGELPIESRLT
ncbi:MAG: MBL fold metallo-hydrolase, partial [Verrucomicrobiota bacterium]|nr:MBL fold metallo-hydrolase [Verrucomicrobiota bacterium]